MEQKKIVQKWVRKNKNQNTDQANQKEETTQEQTRKNPDKHIPATSQMPQRRPTQNDQDPKTQTSELQGTPDKSADKAVNGQGSWQKVVRNRPGKMPVMELDREMEVMCGQAMDVIQVVGNLDSWRGERVIIESPALPTGWT